MKKIILISGPTASGKSTIIEISEREKQEIIIMRKYFFTFNHTPLIVTI